MYFRKFHHFFLPFLCFLFISSFPVPATAGKPRRVVESSHEKINQLLRKEKTGKRGGNLEDEMKKVINRFLDFNSLGVAAMSSHWERLQPDQKKEFIDLFRELIESNYIRRLRGDLDFKVIYGKTVLKGDTARVPTTVERMRMGRKDETEIEYLLRRTGGSWLVYDVITNNVSLADNYRRSFGRIMRRDGFDSLLNTMRRRIEKLR